MLIRVLGSAAGGGFPQWNCGCDNCRGLRDGTIRAQARTQECVAVSADGSGGSVLLNCSPEIRGQIESAPTLHPRAPRHSPISAILLTNGDLDHCLGLLSLRESHRLIVYATDPVERGFTRGNVLYRTLERFPGQVTWHILKTGREEDIVDVDGRATGLTVQAGVGPGTAPLRLEGARPAEPDAPRRLPRAGRRRGRRLGGRLGRDGGENMTEPSVRPPLTREEFIDWVRREGERRYHDHHRYHQLMHDGKLTRLQLQQWVLNRYYYQTRVPIKDALILGKSEDPAFRRMWIRRIRDHDGDTAGEGGLELWLRLAEGVGLDRQEVASSRSVLPGVRFACDGYVHLVRERSLLEAVASSLTEFFSPDLMTRRVLAWERHYPWIDKDTLDYFRTRPPRARQDSLEAIDFVVSRATTYELQEQCVAALIRKTEILWHLLDSLYTAYVEPGWGPGGARA